MKHKKNPKMPDIKKKNPISYAVLNKLNKDEKKSEYPINTGNIENIATSIKHRLESNEDIEQLFPDVELSIQILTSSIISPNDMRSSNLLFKSPDVIMPNGVDSHIMSVISKYIGKNYDIENKLSLILKEALFTKGAYVEAIIPEGTVDDTINIDQSGLSLESFTDTLSTSSSETFFLGTEKTNLNISIESYDNGQATQDFLKDTKTTISEEDLLIDITENTNIVTAGDKFKEYVKHQIDQHFEDTNEATLATEDMQILKTMFGGKKKEQTETINVLNLPAFGDSVKESVDAPLVMKLPVESVIPVHIANDPSKHMGYFIVLDNNGTPITSESKVNLTPDDGMTNSTFKQGSKTPDTKQTLINKAKEALKGITSKDPVLNNIEDMYVHIVDKMIAEKLNKGLYGDIVEMKDNVSLYRVMFARALKGKKTRLLFVPSEMVAYYAFEYRENGTGKSLLEKVATLFSIRATILFSSLLANLKNSITTTTVSAELDPKDPNPEKTMEKIMSESLKSRQSQLPIGINKIDDLVDWTHKVGYRYIFKHPGLPEMTIDKSEEGGSKVVPETDLDEKIQEYIIMSFGLTKEMVMSGYDPEFATTVVANNVLLAKRVIQYQNQFNPMLTDHVRKLLSNDAVIREKIKEIVTNNIPDIKKVLQKHLNSNTTEDVSIKAMLKNKSKMVKFITDLYIKNIEVKLPSPELKENESLKDNLDAYIDAVDTYLEVIIGEDAIPEDFVGDLAGKLDDIRAIMKTVLVKKYMNDNNYISEMSDFLTIDNEGKPVFNILEEFQLYVKTLTDSLMPFLKDSKKDTDSTNNKISKIEDGTSEDDNEALDNSTGNTEGGDGDDNGALDNSTDNTEGGDGADSSDADATDNTDPTSELE